MLAQLTQMIERCEDPDAMLALYALRKHTRRLERAGFRVALRSTRTLRREKQLPGTRGPLLLGVYQTYADGAGGRWLHLNRTAVLDALRSPRELLGLLDWLRDLRFGALTPRMQERLRRTRAR